MEFRPDEWRGTSSCGSSRSLRGVWARTTGVYSIGHKTTNTYSTDPWTRWEGPGGLESRGLSTRQSGGPQAWELESPDTAVYSCAEETRNVVLHQWNQWDEDIVWRYQSRGVRHNRDPGQWQLDPGLCLRKISSESERVASDKTNGRRCPESGQRPVWGRTLGRGHQAWLIPGEEKEGSS